MVRIKKKIYILILFLVLSLPIVEAVKTVKTITIFGGFVADAQANTPYSNTFTFESPDGIKQLYYLKAVITADVSSGTRVYVQVDGEFCTPDYYDVPVSQGRYKMEFDCTGVAHGEGQYTAGFQATNEMKNVYVEWEFTYLNNPDVQLENIWKKVKYNLNFLGTEYQSGEKATTWLQLLRDYEPIDNAICYLNVYDPDKILIKNNSMMVHLDDGIYYYDMTAPSKLGVYMLSAFCKEPANITITPPSDDTYVNTSDPDTNYGNSTSLFVGMTFGENVTGIDCVVSGYCACKKPGTACSASNPCLSTDACSSDCPSDVPHASTVISNNCGSSTASGCICDYDSCTGTCSCINPTGTCDFSCDEGWYNCDDNMDNGCESDTPCKLMSYLKFNISTVPSDFDSAFLFLYKYQGSQCNNSIYKVISTWGENTTTWNNRPSYYDVPYDTISTSMNQWNYWNITSLVQEWEDGTTNYGVTINGTCESQYYSKENPSYKPFLLVSYHNITGYREIKGCGEMHISGSLGKNITSVNNTVDYWGNSLNQTVHGANNSIFSKLYLVQDDLSSINNTIKNESSNLNMNILNNFTYTNSIITSVNNTINWWGNLLNTTVNFWGNKLEQKLDNIILGNVTVTAVVDYDEIALTVVQYFKAVGINFFR